MSTDQVELSANEAAVEPPPYRTRLVRVGRRRVLVSAPNPIFYGHLGIEILYSLAYARLLGVPVCFVRPRRVVNEALLEVDTDEVRVLRSALKRLLPRLAAAEPLRRWRVRTANVLRNEAQAALKRYLDGHRRLPKGVRASLKRTRGSIKSGRGTASWSSWSIRSGEAYNRRRLIAKPVVIRLTERSERRAARLAAAFGLGADTPLVSVHVRERGYKLGAEMQDRNPDRWDDSVRNARIETHFAAIDFLVRNGFTVVRVGDPSMAPVERPGVIDLATSPDRDLLLELWCIVHSRFLLCAESGPLGTSYLTNTPLLNVNATDPIGAFPVRADGVYLLKTILDRETGRRLLPSELLSEEHLRHLRNPTRHRFVENTGEQILDAVHEMLELLERGTPESPAQAAYRELVAEAATAHRHLEYIRKHGADRGYIGVGRLARTLAETWVADDPAVVGPGVAAAAG